MDLGSLTLHIIKERTERFDFHDAEDHNVKVQIEIGGIPGDYPVTAEVVGVMNYSG